MAHVPTWRGEPPKQHVWFKVAIIKNENGVCKERGVDPLHSLKTAKTEQAIREWRVARHPILQMPSITKIQKARRSCNATHPSVLEGRKEQTSLRRRIRRKNKQHVDYLTMSHLLAERAAGCLFHPLVRSNPDRNSDMEICNTAAMSTQAPQAYRT